jgi:hypothetical protein
VPVLSEVTLRRRLEGKPPLVEGWLNLDEQVQANALI